MSNISSQTDLFSKETGEIQDEEIKVLSVSDLNGLIKQSMENQFSLIWLRAEISNFKAHTSGHFYFSLKDSRSQISAVMFRGSNMRLQFKPKDGMEVIVRGRISVYEPRGNYQILVEKMDAVGAGSLQKAFEDLKAKLQNEGLFAQEHKKTLPKLPKKIALITSPTGAAVKDMVQVLGRRYRSAEILILPSLTQGEGAAQSLIESVHLLKKIKVDVAIIGRGGGSIEDLWCFNDENLARALYECDTPIVSAVGHEIDFTICDFVCDLRAPTPSAAAELVSQNVEIVREDIKNKAKNLLLHFKGHMARKKADTRLLSQKLVDPKRKLQDMFMRCEERRQRLVSVVQNQIRMQKMSAKNLQDRLQIRSGFSQVKKEHLFSLSSRLLPGLTNPMKIKKQQFIRSVQLLDSLNPLSVLHRGFSVVRKETQLGQVLTEAKDVQVGEALWVGLANGSMKTKVLEIEENKQWQAQIKRPNKQ
ncbi:MAG: exodeoxyribonuclease VII large subunit [Bdellovibrionaceae bacterium]|nr:exodeoxyribonuclease VII large subunit [Pseudobdellovibrionaceae bacterium]